MNHTYTRAGGVWATGSGLLAAELGDLDAKTVDSISGSGGTYALTEDLVIGGSGALDLEIEAVFRADVTCENDTFLLGPIYHYGSSGFYADAYFYQEAVFEGDFTANNDIFLMGPIYHYGLSGFYNLVEFAPGSDPEFNAATEFNYPATFHSAVSITGPLIATGVTLLGDATHIVQLAGHTQLQRTLTMTGAGSIAHRVVAGDDTVTSFSPLAVHEVVMESGVLTGSTDWYIDDTGCTDGNEILFANKDGGAEITVRRPGGATITSLTADWVRCVRIAGVWQMSQKGSF